MRLITNRCPRPIANGAAAIRLRARELTVLDIASTLASGRWRRYRPTCRKAGVRIRLITNRRPRPIANGAAPIRLRAWELAARDIDSTLASGRGGRLICGRAVARILTAAALRALETEAHRTGAATASGNRCN